MTENTLYHYTTGQGLFGILESQELHCTHINFLNDPSELSYLSGLVKSVLEENPHLKPVYEAFYDKSYQQVFFTGNPRYILSFSRNNDSLTMWGNYSKGNGYNIGFEFEDVFGTKDDVSINEVTMIYEISEQKEALVNFLKLNIQNLAILKDLKFDIEENEDEYFRNHSRKQGMIADFNDILYYISLGFKHPAYKNEEEERIIISFDSGLEKGQRFRVSNKGTIVEFFPFKIDLKKNINSITLHPLNGDLQLRGLQNYLESKNLDYDLKVSSIPFQEV